ncbi:MAG: FMN-binding protein [Lachnospiraceae bacterium]|nr:FMN-binding protein [Lachnospiraceae bacterium]
MANDKKRGFAGRDAIMLLIITLAAGLLLGFFNDLTADTIAQRKVDDETAASIAVCPSATSFEEWPVEEFGNFEFNDDVTGVKGSFSDGKMTFASGASCDMTNFKLGLGSDGQTAGFVITVVSHDGYGGDIEMIIGLDADAVVSGVEMLTINESAGLGANASKEEFRDQYVGHDVKSYAVTKMGKSAEYEIDALSGATITSKAVTDGVNTAVAAARQIVEGEN